MDIPNLESLGAMLLIVIGTLLSVGGAGSAINYLSGSETGIEPLIFGLIVVSILAGAVMIVLGSDMYTE